MLLLFYYSAADIDLLVSQGLLPIISSISNTRNVQAQCIVQISPSNIPDEERLSLLSHATSQRLLQMLAVSSG